MATQIIYSVNLLPWREYLLQRRKYWVIGIVITDLLCCLSIIIAAIYYQQQQSRAFARKHEDYRQQVRWLQQRDTALSIEQKMQPRSSVAAESYQLLFKLAQNNSEFLQITHFAYHDAHWQLQGKAWRAVEVRQIQQLLPRWQLKSLIRDSDNEWHFSLIREE